MTVKSAVYALPANAETREDFAWLAQGDRRERRRGDRLRGELVDGLTDDEVQALFDAARDADYARIAVEARELAARLAGDPPGQWLAEIASAGRARLRKQLDASCRPSTSSAPTAASRRRAGLRASRRRLSEGEAMSDEEATEGIAAAAVERTADLGDAPGRAGRPHRLGLADPPLHRPGRALQVRARQRLRPAAGRDALRHVRGRVHPRGDRCTFEVLLARPASPIRRSRAIGEIVHDIDLKDGKFGREEAAGIEHA